MKPVLHQSPDPEKQAALQALEAEIANLEKALNEAEISLNAFTSQIRQQLAPQIQRLNLLVSRYKNIKQEKKAKRLEQKKKGKHYQPPSALPVPKNGTESNAKTPNQSDLKKLYKEAIVLVHPDKVGAEHTEQATALTIQLNELYASGDLEDLQGFHEHILSGNAFSHLHFGTAKAADPDALLEYLQTKRNNLEKALQELQTSELYHVLKTYAEPLTFIPELKRQFEERIAVFEKRTRKFKA